MTDAKPYTLAEVKTGGVLYVNHGRIAATVEALERAEARADDNDRSYCIMRDALESERATHRQMKARAERAEAALAKLNQTREMDLGRAALLERAEKAEAALAAVTAERDAAQTLVGEQLDLLHAMKSERDAARALYDDALRHPMFVDAHAAMASTPAPSHKPGCYALPYPEGRGGECSCRCATPAPASMPLAEVEALKMRVAEAVRTAMVGVTVFDALARSEMRELDLAAVVKGVK